MRRHNAIRGSVLVLLALGTLVPGGLCGKGGQAAAAGREYRWAWTKGASTTLQPGVYGSLGVQAPGNLPGARRVAVSWTDSTGGMWLFGGAGYTLGTNNGYLNDLWKYDRATGNWAWMKGSTGVNQPGNFGVIGVPAAGNNPGGRIQAVSWRDSSNALWLFGGSGYASSSTVKYLNDLWKYSPATGNWVWISGSTAGSQNGVYGALGVPAAGNTPGGRLSSVSWTDSSGMLWLFGGTGYAASGGEGNLNDLWKYDPATGTWTWMKGGSATGQRGTYGTRGVAAAANTPGGRTGSSSWTDPSGMLWLFGGFGYDSSGGQGWLNDLWKFDPVSRNWTWVKGSSTNGQAGTYGTLGTPAAANIPGGRYGAMSWMDSSGDLLVLGGVGLGSVATSLGYLNDLWKYDQSEGTWVWLKGATIPGALGTYGTLGTPAAANTPGARNVGVSWTDSSGMFWLLGGEGLDAAGSAGVLSDLWRCPLVDTDPPTGTVVINDNRSVTGSVNVKLALTWDDTDGSGVVRMKFSNDSVTWTAWEPVAATKTWTLPAGDGYKTVRAMFRDVDGNNSAICTDYIRLDATPPTGGIIINAGAASTKSRTVSLGLVWSDGTGAGVSRMRFSIDGATWTNWEPLKTPRSYTLPAPLGYYTVRVQYLDGGNNYSAVYNDYIKLIAP